MKPYTVSWGVRHEPGGSYVVEQEDDRPITLYGPMPAAITGAFILERQAAVRKVFNRVIERLGNG